MRSVSSPCTHQQWMKWGNFSSAPDSFHLCVRPSAMYDLKVYDLTFSFFLFPVPSQSFAVGTAASTARWSRQSYHESGAKVDLLWSDFGSDPLQQHTYGISTYLSTLVTERAAAYSLRRLTKWLLYHFTTSRFSNHGHLLCKGIHTLLPRSASQVKLMPGSLVPRTYQGSEFLAEEHNKHFHPWV